MQSVNTSNWTYSRYKKGDFMALVTFGADPESIKEDRLECVEPDEPVPVVGFHHEEDDGWNQQVAQQSGDVVLQSASSLGWNGGWSGARRSSRLSYSC